MPSSGSTNTQSEYTDVEKHIFSNDIVIELLTSSGPDVLRDYLKSDNIRMSLCDENTKNVDDFLSNLGQ